MTLQQHLELICKYLPHKVMYLHNGNVAELMPYHLGMHLKNIERGDDWKLCLRPLSDLVKPCLLPSDLATENEIKWTPMAHLARYSTVARDMRFEKVGFCGNEAYIETSYYGRMFSHKGKLTYDCHNMTFRRTQDYKEVDVRYQHYLFNLLHQWHFFLGDQSLFGKEIIDINTLNK